MDIAVSAPPTPAPARQPLTTAADHRIFPVRFLVALAATAALQGWAADAAPAAAGAEPEAFRWSAFLGPFHVLLLHFPIGFIAAAAGLEVLSWRRPGPDLRFSVRTLLWLCLGVGAAASAAGLLRASEGGFDPDLVVEHRNHAYGFLAATLATAVCAHLAHRRTEPGKITWVYRGFLALALALVGSAGHHGGSLTHGADFLTEGAPPFVLRILQARGAKAPGVDPAKSTASGTNSGATATGSSAGPVPLYETTVRPIFESRCYPCHGPEKHKGDYRLDRRDDALRAGESGTPAIVPGDPMKSNLLRVLMLPRDHDEAMPPEGKQGVTADEILAISRWIQSGAPFGPP